MNILEISLISSALLCSLVAGITLVFAIVVMPGISKFEDKEFLKAFQLIDGVIQNNQPLFLLVWLGSIISVLLTILSSIIMLGFLDSLIIICVCSSLCNVLGINSRTICSIMFSGGISGNVSIHSQLVSV